MIKNDAEFRIAMKASITQPVTIVLSYSTHGIEKRPAETCREKASLKDVWKQKLNLLAHKLTIFTGPHNIVDHVQRHGRH
jgi:hypothetical protein